MLSESCGSFLSARQKGESLYQYNKPLIRLACAGFLAFSLAALATVGGALFFSVYSAPRPIVPAASYSKANAASSRVTKSLAVIREARPQGIDVCNVIAVVSEAVAASKENVSVKDLLVKPQAYTVKGVGKDVLAVNDFLKALDFDSKKYDKQIGDIKSNPKSVAPPMPGQAVDPLAPKEVPVEFTIQITSKAAAKKTPARPAQQQGANAAPKGGAG